MGNEDAERVDTDWSGRPAARRREWAELKKTDGGALLGKRADGTWMPVFRDLVVEEIDGRNYTEGEDGKWYPVDEKLRVGKEPVDPYAEDGEEE